MLDHYLHTACPRGPLLIHPTSRTDHPAARCSRAWNHERPADIVQAHGLVRGRAPGAARGASTSAAGGRLRHPRLAARLGAGALPGPAGHWDDWLAAEQIVLTATERLGDRGAQAFAHWQFGYARARLGDHEDARAHLEQALSMYTELGDRAGAADAHTALGVTLEEQGLDADALDHTRKALELFTAAGDRAGQALALNGIGWLYIKLGYYRQALTSCGQALELFQELGYPGWRPTSGTASDTPTTTSAT